MIWAFNILEKLVSAEYRPLSPGNWFFVVYPSNGFS